MNTYMPTTEHRSVTVTLMIYHGHIYTTIPEGYECLRQAMGTGDYK